MVRSRRESASTLDTAFNRLARRHGARGSGPQRPRKLVRCGNVREIDQVDQQFPASHRIRHRAEFRRVYNRRQRVSDAVLIVYICENDLGVSRLGLSVSRRVGPAHFRNRWKRLIRESFRRIHHQLEPGFDFVVIPRQRVEPELQIIRDSLKTLSSRLQRRLKKKRT